MGKVYRNSFEKLEEFGMAIDKVIIKKTFQLKLKIKLKIQLEFSKALNFSIFRKKVKKTFFRENIKFLI